MRVLICDDSAVGREIITRPFVTAGSQVDEVSDMETAIAACAVIAYDVILLEKTVLFWDGVGSVREIRHLCQGAWIALVASVNVHEIAAVDLVMSGTDEVLTVCDAAEMCVLAVTGKGTGVPFHRC